MSETLDIISIINDTPITIVSNKDKLLNKLQSQFSDDEQRLFLANFYCYQKFRKPNEFVINLNEIYEWIGYSRKDKAKELLTKHFIENVDYIKLQESLGEVFPRSGENPLGGRPTEKIMISIQTFKMMCLKAQTKKADQIHHYYIKLESVINQLLEEETQELRQQLTIMEQKAKKLEEQVQKQTGYIYVGVNKAIHGVSKIGISDNILKRSDNHKSSNPDFEYRFTYKTKNNKQIESCIKSLLKPFLYNKSEWFEIDVDDMIFLTEFVIDMYDKQDGITSSKNLVDFLRRLRSRTVIEKLQNELIPNSVYDSFFNDNIEFDNNYRCTFLRLQQKIDEWLIENNYLNVKTKNDHNNFTTAYRNDIKRYIREKFNKELETISIRDIKNNIHLSSYLGFKSFRLKSDYAGFFFDDDIYKRFVQNHLVIDSSFTTTVLEIAESFEHWLKDNNIKINKPFKTEFRYNTTFREELTKAIEYHTGLTKSQKVTNKKYSGYSGFKGLKLI